MHVIATAGHVDHGKSTLVRALTGIDPDRLAEEKERGLTIDLGFAWATLPSGRGVSFVDVPGHIRFIRNMLAGVGAVDACLFVVAATEGWKPQSEEHLRILQLLGLRHGVVALTKIGLADEELVELAQLELEEHLEGTFLETAPVVPLDTLTGQGLDDFIAALDTLTESMPTATDSDRPRLWIDRAFAAKGSGTVVTGTLTGGTISVGDDLRIEPGHRPARVRAIQSRQAEHEQIGPGNRVALNLSGIDHGEVARGDVVVRPDQWHQTRLVDAELTVLPSLSHEVSRRGAYALHLGSREVPARMRIIGDRPLQAGETGPVRLHLPVALPALPGDRFVLRETGRVETVGGGQLLDVDPQLAASRAAPDRSVDRVIAEHRWLTVDQLERLTGERREPLVGQWVTTAAAVEDLEREVRALVADADELGLDVARLDERQRLVLASFDDVEVVDGRARPAAVPDLLASHPFLEELRASLFTPPDPDGVNRDEIRALVQRGLAIQVDGVVFAAEAADAAARLAARTLADKPGGFTMAEARDFLGTTRKYALPLIGHLDATGVTRRRDDVRIAGPRLPEI